jgi:hypothetical protein
MMSSIHISPSQCSPQCPPLPPLETSTHAADAVLSPAINLSGGLNAEVHNFLDVILSSHEEIGTGNGGNILSEGGTADKINSNLPPSRLLFSINPVGGADENQEGIVFADRPRRSNFPSVVPTVQNHIFNQNPESNNEGYDSERGIPYFADKEEVTAKKYNKALLINDAIPPPEEAESAAVAAVLELTVEGVMLLNVGGLKEELKRRGMQSLGNRGTCRHA